MRKICIVGMMVFLPIVGCTLWTPDPPPIPIVEPQIEVVTEDHGWVQVRVTGVPSTGYRLHWGDLRPPYDVSEVQPSVDTYEHFYQAVEGETSGGQVPMTYTISLTDPHGRIVTESSVRVHRVDCYLALDSIEGRTVTVRYWGRHGIQYSISWGDSYAEHIIVDFQTGSGTLTHTYTQAGEYRLGMEEIWSPTRIFLTLTVE